MKKKSKSQGNADVEDLQMIENGMTEDVIDLDQSKNDEAELQNVDAVGLEHLVEEDIQELPKSDVRDPEHQKERENDRRPLRNDVNGREPLRSGVNVPKLRRDRITNLRLLRNHASYLELLMNSETSPRLQKNESISLRLPKSRSMNP